jgi:PAS domain S-box-containing protein
MMSEEEAARLLGLHMPTMPRWTQGLLITDSARPDNPIIFANAGFAALTGYSPETIVGRNCRFLQGRDTDRRTVEEMRESIAARRRFDGELLNYRRDGTPFWNRLSIGPLTSPGAETLFLGLQFDASDRHRDG